MSCLVISTWFLWMDFMVPLQLLGRMVSDCPSLGDLALWVQEIHRLLCNQAMVVLFSGKMCLPRKWSSATEPKLLKSEH